MSVEIKEIEKDQEYTVNGKTVYKDDNNNWMARIELTAAESKEFFIHRHVSIVTKPRSKTVAKHTPGPWIFIPSELDPKKHSFAVAAEHGSSLVADIYFKSKFFGWGNKKNGRDPETTEANAKLIAAAPDMLKALQTFIARVKPGEVRNGKVSRYNTNDLDESIIVALESIEKATL